MRSSFSASSTVNSFLAVFSRISLRVYIVWSPA
jgi:hypothetical protein